MKLYKYLNKSITIMLLTAVMVGFLSCDDDDQNLGSGSLTNAVIQSVNVQSGNDWKEATQVKVGTKIRMELRNTVNRKVLCIYAILLAKHISDTHCLKSHIPAAVTFTVDRKLCVSEFLSDTLSNRYAVTHITLHIQGLLFIIIESCHIRIRKFIG